MFCAWSALAVTHLCGHAAFDERFPSISWSSWFRSRVASRLELSLPGSPGVTVLLAHVSDYRWLRHFVQDVVIEFSGKRGIVRVGRGRTGSDL